MFLTGRELGKFLDTSVVSVLAKVFPSYLGKLFLATIERSKNKEKSRKDVSMKNQGKVKYATRYSRLKFAVWCCYLFFSLTSKDSSKEFSMP